ncbi:MAG TPA: histidine kinase, partial [Solirubrobacteraceae bacterium]|nr:histidine kinase [Solirubrobacteraceae bacterium]
PHAPGLVGRALAHARSRATWKELGWALLLVPVGFAASAVVLAMWSLTLVLLIAPVAGPLAPGDSWLGELPTIALVLAPVTGVVVLAATVLMAEGTGIAVGALAHALLGPDEREALEARVDTLKATRAGAVDSADATLRRIERDLHDGAQHRLAYVAMELGRARQKLKTDPEAAAPLIDRAFEESKNAMAELRDLVRGIHPSILADRGLEAAISGLAGRCPVPVQIDVDLPERPGVAVETAAYFVVAEALTNAGKHSGAQRALVDVRYHDARRLLVTVADDGVGGATGDDGGGLAGLRQRVEALDGTLLVTSPPGNGTTVTAVFPAATTGTEA